MKCNTLNLGLSAIRIVLCLTLFEWAVPTFAQEAKERNVTGTITDEKNQPLVGVSIIVPQSTIGTSTDIKGEFSLKVPEGKNELRISLISYESATVQIPANNVVHFQMNPNIRDLNEAYN